MYREDTTGAAAVNGPSATEIPAGSGNVLPASASSYLSCRCSDQRRPDDKSLAKIQACRDKGTVSGGNGSRGMDRDRDLIPQGSGAVAAEMVWMSRGGGSKIAKASLPPYGPLSMTAYSEAVRQDSSVVHELGVRTAHTVRHRGRGRGAARARTEQKEEAGLRLPLLGLPQTRGTRNHMQNSHHRDASSRSSTAPSAFCAAPARPALPAGTSPPAPSLPVASQIRPPAAETRSVPKLRCGSVAVTCNRSLVDSRVESWSRADGPDSSLSDPLSHADGELEFLDLLVMAQRRHWTLVEHVYI